MCWQASGMSDAAMNIFQILPCTSCTRSVSCWTHFVWFSFGLVSVVFPNLVEHIFLAFFWISFCRDSQSCWTHFFGLSFGLVSVVFPKNKFKQVQLCCRWLESATKNLATSQLKSRHQARSVCLQTFRLQSMWSDAWEKAKLQFAIFSTKYVRSTTGSQR